LISGSPFIVLASHSIIVRYEKRERMKASAIVVLTLATFLLLGIQNVSATIVLTQRVPSIEPVTVKVGQSVPVPVTFELQNNEWIGLPEKILVEACINPPKGLLSYLAVVSKEQCCPGNTFCDDAWVELAPGEKKVVTLTPITQTPDTIDHCAPTGQEGRYWKGPGIYSVNLVSVDKCCTYGADCVAVSPFYWGFYVGSIKITPTGNGGPDPFELIVQWLVDNYYIVIGVIVIVAGAIYWRKR